MRVKGVEIWTIFLYDYRNFGPKFKFLFPKYAVSSFLEAYEVVDRPRLYRIARKSKRGVAPKVVS